MTKCDVTEVINKTARGRFVSLTDCVDAGHGETQELFVLRQTLPQLQFDSRAVAHCVLVC